MVGNAAAACSLCDPVLRGSGGRMLRDIVNAGECQQISSRIMAADSTAGERPVKTAGTTGEGNVHAVGMLLNFESGAKLWRKLILLSYVLHTELTRTSISVTANVVEEFSELALQFTLVETDMGIYLG